MKVGVIFKAMRGPFLVLTPVCVFLGVSAVVASQISVDLQLLALSFFGALLAHISANTLNEYFDFKSGLDRKTIKTPFSGGSGALPKNPEMANMVLAVGIISLVATILIGVFFVWQYGVGIVSIGVLGLLLIVTYTEWINKHPILCLMAPGIGFGFLMVMGTQFVLVGKFSMLSWIVAVIPFFLINNLLLLNQYPDIQADKDVGRNHFPIAYGATISNVVYGLFVLMTILVILICVFIGKFPILSLIALLPLPIAFYSLSGVIKHGVTTGNCSKYLGANVVVALVTPALLGVSLIIG